MRTILALAASVVLAGGAPAMAQEFPNQTIRIVIPYAPGGGSDILARPVAPIMSEILRQQVVIENRGGAAGNIGAASVARSPADGYSLLMANNSHTINPFMYKDPGFDMAKDFAPVSLVGTAPILVVAHKSLGVKTIGELVAMAQASPGKLTFGSPGAGTPGYLANFLFNKQSGINVVHVPYKGSGPMLIGQVQNEVNFAFSTPAAVEAHVKAGTLVALAVTSKERFPAFPDVPTLSESGIPALKDFAMEIWWGLLAPAGTPEAVIAKLNDAVRKAAADPKVQAGWIAQGLVPKTNTPAEFRALVAAELTRWEKVVAEAGITPQ